MSWSAVYDHQYNVLQVNSKFEEFLDDLKMGLSEECCFDNHNITTEKAEFETGEEPIESDSVQRIFVR